MATKTKASEDDVIARVFELMETKRLSEIEAIEQAFTELWPQPKVPCVVIHKDERYGE
jgi:hypothetical protein